MEFEILDPKPSKDVNVSGIILKASPVELTEIVIIDSGGIKRTLYHTNPVCHYHLEKGKKIKIENGQEV